VDNTYRPHNVAYNTLPYKGTIMPESDNMHVYDFKLNPTMLEPWLDYMNQKGPHPEGSLEDARKRINHRIIGNKVYKRRKPK
jgi:hypothetical protein